MEKERESVTCPFLGEVLMEYCGAYPIRKPIPKKRIGAGICAGVDHLNCPYFNEFVTKIRCRIGRTTAQAEDELDDADGGTVFCSSPGRNPTRPESGPDPGARKVNTRRPRRRVGLRKVGDLLLHPGFFYHRGHTWVMPYAVGEARVGLDDFGRRLLDGIRAIHVPPPETILQQGQAVVALDCGEHHAWLVSPVDGVITAVNEELLEDPSLLARDSYGDGWLFAVRLRDESFATYPTGNAAAEWLRRETDRLCTLLHEDLGLTATDGGSLIAAPAAAFGPVQWDALVRAFFLHRNDGPSEPPTT